MFVIRISNLKYIFRPAGFVQVGDWVYPLVPGQSPVLLNANGAYIFPNVTAENSNSRSVGVVLSSRLDPEYEEVFRHFLTTMASLQVSLNSATITSMYCSAHAPRSGLFLLEIFCEMSELKTKVGQC